MKDSIEIESGMEMFCLSGGLFYVGVVVAADRDVGLTIVNRENKEEYLACINGPLSPIMKALSPARRKKDTVENNALYDYFEDCIINKKPAVFEEALEIMSKFGGRMGCSPDSSDCPYNQ